MRLVNRLTAKSAQAKRKPGYHPDGNGLYLQVSPSGSKSWILRYAVNGKRREMGLGSFLIVSLDDARKLAEQHRKNLADKVDPIAARDAALAQRRLEEARAMTFDQCGSAYVAAHRASWKNAKHAAQWEATLATYASPIIGKSPVQAVDTPLVMKVLNPIWYEKSETASRVRGRIESVLDWAKVSGYRTGENPARWRGHLDHLLPKRSSIVKVKHHEALPYADIGAFMGELRQREGIAAKALEFIILTAARVSEAVNAKWEEFDFRKSVWMVPAERMKAKREHRVPLSLAAVAVLKHMRKQQQSEYVFPGWRTSKPVSSAACLNLLDDMGRPSLTVHGFRSTFRDWVAEQTSYPREIAEAALAHVLTDKTEAAYQRGDLLERRGVLMAEWAQYCAKERPAANVVSLRGRAKA